MIIQLSGKIKFKTDKFVVVDVNGVGYQVFVSYEALKEISSKEEANPDGRPSVTLWTHQHIRENILDLYGFLNYAELEFFQILIGISGVGPKSALGVLSVAPIDVLKRAIASGETSYLTKVSGVGKKLAEKIVVELRDKMGAIGIKQTSEELRDETDALEALQALGYSLSESREALRNLPEDVKGMENRVKEALKNIK